MSPNPMPAACVSPFWQAQGASLVPMLVGSDSRVIAWHAGRLMAKDAHMNYHLGFRCCKDLTEGGATP